MPVQPTGQGSQVPSIIQRVQQMPVVGNSLRVVANAPGILRSTYTLYGKNGQWADARDHVRKSIIQLWEPVGQSERVEYATVATSETPHIEEMDVQNPDRWLQSSKHLSSNLLRSLFAFYERDYGSEALDDLLSSLGTDRKTVQDPSRWFSVERFIEINEALVQATRDPDITRKAALAFPDFMNVHERLIIKALGGVRGCGEVYRQILAAGKEYSTVTEWKSTMTSANTASIAFSPKPGISDHRTFCRNRLGFLETIPTLLGDPRAEVEHTECLHAGGDACVYNVKWMSQNFGHQIPLLTAGATAFASGAAYCAGFDLDSIKDWIGIPGTFLTLGAYAYDAHMQLRQTRTWHENLHADTQEYIKEYKTIIARLESALDFASNASQYLSPHVIQQLKRPDVNDKNEALKGRTEEATILFCDIVGFTPKSQACQDDPLKVAAVLNEWFSIVDPIIEQHGGILDKRIGDAVMVVFLNKDGQAHPVKRAADVSIAIQRALRDNRSKIAEIAPEFAEMLVRVGFAHGKVVVGNLGSKERVEFTVIGHAVNTASRIEGIAPKGGIAMSESAFLAAGGFETIPQARKGAVIELKGQDQTQIYEIDWG